MKFKLNDRIVSNPDFNDIRIPPYNQYVIIGISRQSYYIIEKISTSPDRPCYIRDINIVDSSFSLIKSVDESIYLNPGNLKSKKICEHSWIKYSGLTDEFMFCFRCDEKQR